MRERPPMGKQNTENNARNVVPKKTAGTVIAHARANQNDILVPQGWPATYLPNLDHDLTCTSHFQINFDDTSISLSGSL